MYFLSFILVSIPHRYYKSFIFIKSKRIIIVSIPHRYYKSISENHTICLIDKFQFLIGIINLMAFCAPSIFTWFQFLIGIINRILLCHTGEASTMFQFLIGIINLNRLFFLKFGYPSFNSS